MKKTSQLTALFLAVIISLFAAGCGNTESDPFSEALESFDICIGENKADVKMKNGDLLAFADGALTLTDAAENETRLGADPLTVSGIGTGNTVYDVLDEFDVKSGYAELNFEYDPYGDGCTAVEDTVFDGELPDAEELRILDMQITLAYYYYDGEWLPLCFENRGYDDYKYIVTFSFDTEGVCDLYADEQGEIFSVGYSVFENE